MLSPAKKWTVLSRAVGNDCAYPYWDFGDGVVPRMSTGRCTKPLNNLPDPFLMDNTGKNSHVSL